MAHVISVHLDILYPSIIRSGNEKATITVTSELSFTAEEIGNKYQLRIALFGEDTGSRPFAFSHIPLYVFRFGFLPRHDFTQITATQIFMTHTEERIIPLTVLDEDSGLKNDDEVFARVSLANETRSNIAVIHAVRGIQSRIDT